MEKTILINVNEYENLENLERLYLGDKGYQSIIDYLMTSHKHDASFLKTPIFEQYMLDYQLNSYLYEKEKDEFSIFITDLMEKQGYNLERISDMKWQIIDFSSKLANVTFIED